MTTSDTNLRKAAVFIRSLDAETAAAVLARLSPDEAAAVRAAISYLSQVDPDEQADVAAEFRSARTIATEPAVQGVELELTSTEVQHHLSTPIEVQSTTSHGRRFEFLERAPIDTLVPYLSREHVQTIAVVLSHLAPRRAATILANLPEKLQAETVERLAILGETDPESVIVLENELAVWLATRATGRPGNLRRNDTVSSILSAADVATRNGIIANLRSHKASLAEELAPAALREKRRAERSAIYSGQAAACARRIVGADSGISLLRAPKREEPRLPPQPRFNFEDLIHFDGRALTALLRELDTNVLVLALAGSKEELIDHVCHQMPKPTARALRRQLRQLGPTRLSDVEAAQRAVALVATEQLDARRAAASMA